MYKLQLDVTYRMSFTSPTYVSSQTPRVCGISLPELKAVWRYCSFGTVTGVQCDVISLGRLLVAADGGGRVPHTHGGIGNKSTRRTRVVAATFATRRVVEARTE